MSATGNRFLDSLPAALAGRIIASAVPVDLPRRTSLWHSGSKPAYLHFLVSGLTSVVIRMKGGASAEVGMTGTEGIVGGTALLGPAPSPAEAFMQMSGAGIRIPFRLGQELFRDDADFRNHTLQHVQAQMHVASQTAACNRLHEAHARLARWVLMTADRTEQTVLSLTQEFLAEMLGTRRSTVALTATELQGKGGLAYRRGVVEIIDRARLEKAACECYPLTKDVLRRLYA
jgi:CRP-like cAMP-binding protein